MITPTVDLEFHVTAQVVAGRTRLSYELRSKKLGYRGRHIPGPELMTQPEEFQAGLLARLEALNRQIGPDASQLDSTDVVPTIESLGRQLYEQLFPAELREAYREFRDEVRTLLIVSNEPWIPWELVKPEESRDGKVLFKDELLCWRFELSRWLPDVEAPPVEIDPTRLLCIEAGDPGKAESLKHAKKEARFVTRLAKRKAVASDRMTDATFEDVQSALESGGNDWIHFVGHGKHDPEDPYGSGILLVDGRSLCPRDVNADMKAHFQNDRPLVFFNSCEVGRRRRS